MAKRHSAEDDTYVQCVLMYDRGMTRAEANRLINAAADKALECFDDDDDVLAKRMTDICTEFFGPKGYLYAGDIANVAADRLGKEIKRK